MRASVSNERKAYEKGLKEGIHDAVCDMIPAMCLVLADKFGFNEEQMISAIEYFNDAFTAVNEKRIKVKDIVETLNEDYGIGVKLS